MRALVIGSSGFVGQHLVKELMGRGYEVDGISWRNGDDIRDYEKMRNLINLARPDRIYHLAAQPYVPESFTNPVRSFEVNTIGAINVLEAVRQLGIKTRVLLAGTSEEYGDTSGETEPITERSLPNPLSPYAISKLAMDYMGQLYARSYGIPIIVTRTYNHAGPGRGEMYAESSFAKQIVEIERGTRKKLEHGNLETVRNYIDVRDVVKAYLLAIELEPDVYNVCSDESVTMQKMLDILISHATVPIDTEVNPSLYRPSDFSFKKPSCEKFTNLTDWKPEIGMNQMLEDVLSDWRKRL